MKIVAWFCCLFLARLQPNLSLDHLHHLRPQTVRRDRRGRMRREEARSTIIPISVILIILKFATTASGRARG